MNEFSTVLVATIWGAMIVFSFVMAPLIFTKLPDETAGNFIRQVFPMYYLVLGAVTLVAALSLIVGGVSIGAEPWILIVVAVGFAAARQVLMPRINRLRDQVKAGDGSVEASFERLHRLSVAINSVQIVLVLIVLVSLS